MKTPHKILILLILLLTSLSYAVGAGATSTTLLPLIASHYSVNGTVTKTGSKWYMTYMNTTVNPNTSEKFALPTPSTTWDVKPVNGAAYSCSGSGEESGGIISNVTSASCLRGSSATASVGIAGVGGNPVYNEKTYSSDLFNCNISDTTTESPLICWIKAVFVWSQTALLVAGLAVFVFAGINYMTSGGNPKRIDLSKKLIVGALSGIAVIVLGRFFLTQVIGVQIPWL